MSNRRLVLSLILASLAVAPRSYDDVVARVAARAKDTPAGTWITGRGWDQKPVP